MTRISEQDSEATGRSGSKRQHRAGSEQTGQSAGTPTLGMILRSLRARNNWSLKEMSERSGIPVSTLSKVEHDRLSLTYDKLLQVSRNLGLSISDLFSEASPSGGQAVMGRRSIGTYDQSVRVKTPNYDYYYLCTELRKKRMIPILTKIRAKSLEAFGDLVSHSGEEFIYVLAGEIEVHTEFYSPVKLGTGESIYLDSNMGHAYLAADACEEATVLGVCSSADPDLMESLMSLMGEMQPG